LEVRVKMKRYLLTEISFLAAEAFLKVWEKYFVDFNERAF